MSRHGDGAERPNPLMLPTTCVVASVVWLLPVERDTHIMLLGLGDVVGLRHHLLLDLDSTGPRTRSFQAWFRAQSSRPSERGMMRIACLALATLLFLERAAASEPATGTGTSTGTDAAQSAHETTVDLEHAPQPADTHPVAAAATLGGMYAAFAGWMYIAWYQHHRSNGYRWGGDGWLGDRTYAGGADKFGHAWSTMALARAGTELLDQWGGYDRGTANLVSTSLSELLFLGVEFRDGFNYEFSFSDLTGDTVGALLAYALTRWPRLDELFDYRVEYLPSQMYLKKLGGSSPCPVGSCSRWDIAEDYSGQTYLLAFHLGGIHALRDMRYGTWARFVDLTLGFDTRNYRPTPDPELMQKPHQDVFVGISLNAQGLFDYLLDQRSNTRKVTHGLFEVFNVPYTSAALVGHQHYANGTPSQDGGL